MNDNYLPIPPLFIILNDDINFNIYLKHNNDYVLYATPASFKDEHKVKLKEYDVEYIYISNNEKINYHDYIEKKLPDILNSPVIPSTEKAKLIYNHSLELVDDMFVKSKHNVLDTSNYIQIKNLINNIFSFITNTGNGIQTIQKLISTSYDNYVHCMNTCVYAMSLMLHHSITNNNDRPKRSVIRQIGTAAILHDIGKIKIDQNILNKREKLTNREFEEIKKHTIYGLEMSQFMELDQTISNCILFHHEKLDGSGYPTGTTNISYQAQIVSIADIYAAMTCDRVYRKKLSAFESLKYMNKEVSRNRLNKELVKSFIELISSNQFTI